MKQTLYTLCALGALALSGCNDFLEPSSSDEYVPENATSLDEMLVGEAYTDPQANEHLFFFHNALDDDITMARENVGFNPTQPLQESVYYSVYTLQPDIFTRMEEAYMYDWMWNAYYSKILGANAALDYVDEVTDTEEMKDYVRAQALGLRAFYYFNLVNLFGAPFTADANAPGVPLKLSSHLSTSPMPRATVGEVYRQILADFTTSADLFRRLPANRQYSENYRINLPTVLMLKARACLFMEDWGQAIACADSVLDFPQFELYDLTTFVPTASTPKPHYSDYDNGESMWHYGCTTDLCQFASVTGYPAENMSNTRYMFNASDELLATYEEGDLRKDLYIFDEYYRTTQLPNKKAMGKLLCNESQQVLSGTGFALSVRLSEAYLTLAEAHAELGHTAEALECLNRLRAKRIANCRPLVGLEGEELVRFVHNERRREFCFEGMRWFDLRRWGMEGFTKQWRTYDNEAVNYVIRDNDPAFTLPIPQEMIDRNPALSQNPLAPARMGQ